MVARVFAMRLLGYLGRLLGCLLCRLLGYPGWLLLGVAMVLGVVAMVPRVVAKVLLRSC